MGYSFRNLAVLFTIPMKTTIHRLIHRVAQDLSFLQDESIHLVITSPPCWNVKRYNENLSQIGHIEDYEKLLNEKG